MLGTILIIEDHEAMRKLLREWLEMVFPQYQIVGTATAEEGISAVETHPPRVAIVDINLPKMNGIEVTKRIKAMLPSVEIVILTIHEDDVHRADALAAGACAYVPKRMMQKEFIPVLKELLPDAVEAGCPAEKVTANARDSALFVMNN